MAERKEGEQMKTILLIGLGRFGRNVAKKLNELGHEVMAIDSSEERVNAVLPYLTPLPQASLGGSGNLTRACLRWQILKPSPNAY